MGDDDTENERLREQIREAINYLEQIDMDVIHDQLEEIGDEFRKAFDLVDRCWRTLRDAIERPDW